MPLEIIQESLSADDRGNLPCFEPAPWIATGKLGGTGVMCDGNALEAARAQEGAGCSIMAVLRKELA